MGRKKKYHTDEERKEAQKEYARRYYNKNKQALDQKQREYYRDVQKRSKDKKDRGED